MLQSHFQCFYQGNPSIQAAIASRHWYNLFLFDLQRHRSRSRSRASQSHHSRIAQRSRPTISSITALSRKNSLFLTDIKFISVRDCHGFTNLSWVAGTGRWGTGAGLQITTPGKPAPASMGWRVCRGFVFCPQKKKI
jgi:hypothetical protein